MWELHSVYCVEDVLYVLEDRSLLKVTKNKKGKIDEKSVRKSNMQTTTYIE